MKTIEQLNKIRVEKRIELDLRKNTNADTREKHILVCNGTGCTSSKSPQILDNFRKIIEETRYKECKSYKNRLFWIMCQRSNCYNKTRRYFLCNGKTRRL